MLDRDLAELYGVSTKALNQAVKRNGRRFPPDFMFQLSKEEKGELVTNCDRFTKLKHSSVLPRAFTEQGVAMLSSVLKSQRRVKRGQRPFLMRIINKGRCPLYLLYLLILTFLQHRYTPILQRTL
jgi:hypothetical protein